MCLNEHIINSLSLIIIFFRQISFSFTFLFYFLSLIFSMFQKQPIYLRLEGGEY